jgi:hypothetical protein
MNADGIISEFTKDINSPDFQPLIDSGPREKKSFALGEKERDRLNELHTKLFTLEQNYEQSIKQCTNVEGANKLAEDYRTQALQLLRAHEVRPTEKKTWKNTFTKCLNFIKQIIPFVQFEKGKLDYVEKSARFKAQFDELKQKVSEEPQDKPKNTPR